MTRQRALQLALAILRPFAEAGHIYEDYQADEGFTDDEYDAMLTILAEMLREQGEKTGSATVTTTQEGT